MDPTAALLGLLNAFDVLLHDPDDTKNSWLETSSANRQEVLDRMTDLQQWIAGGGFAPNVPGAILGYRGELEIREDSDYKRS